MGKPTLEEFRRWLQSEINEIEAIEEGVDKAKRLLQLEMALQEAMAFDAAWELRTESSIIPVVREKSVRLLSSAPDTESVTESGLICASCEAEIDDDLPFCPACGENR
jgi:rRNA maturation endonuclease Nob1